MYRILLIVLSFTFIYIEQCNFQRQDVDTITELRMEITKVRKENKDMNGQLLSIGSKWLEEYQEAKSIKAYNESIKKQSFESLLNNFFIANNLGPIEDILIKLEMKKALEDIIETLKEQNFTSKKEVREPSFFQKIETLRKVLGFSEEKGIKSLFRSFFSTKESVEVNYASSNTPGKSFKGNEKNLFELIEKEISKLNIDKQEDDIMSSEIPNDINSLKDLIVSLLKAITNANRKKPNNIEGIAANISHKELHERILKLMQGKGVSLIVPNIGLRGDTQFIEDFIVEKGV